MAKIKNSYFSLAYNDLYYLRKYDEDDVYSYNRVSVESQQVVEKLLKGLIEVCEGIAVDQKAKLLGTHNLKKLGEAVNEQYHKNLNISDLAYLKDFYYEARYPGDSFTEVNKIERDKCIKIVDEVLVEVVKDCPDFPVGLLRMNYF